MKKLGTVFLWAAVIVGSLFGFMAIFNSYDTRKPQDSTASSPRSSIEVAQASSLGAGGELARAFTFVTSMTDLQVKNIEERIKGTIVEWSGPVDNVDDGPSGLVVYASETGSSVAFECWITDPTAVDRTFAAGLMRGQIFTCKGAVDRAATFGGLVLSPAVMVP